MFSTARYSSYSWRSGTPQYSVPRSVSARFSGMSCCSKNGKTRSLSRSAAVTGALRSYSGKTDLAVGVDEGLLVDPTHALQGADIERILGTAIAGTFAHEFSVRFFIRGLLLQGHHLGFGEHQSFLSHLRFQRLQSFPHRFEIMAEPNASNARR